MILFFSMTGSLDNLSFYKVKGSDKIHVRLKGRVSKKRMKTDPGFAIPRLRQQEFAGRWAMLIFRFPTGTSSHELPEDFFDYGYLSFRRTSFPFFYSIVRTAGSARGMDTRFLAEAAEAADEAAEWNGLPFSVFFCVISGICERKWIPKFLAEVAENADEAAEWNGLPFSVFFRVIGGICERKWIPKFLAEVAEGADEAAEWND